MNTYNPAFDTDVTSESGTSESHVDVIETVISSLDQYDNALVNHPQEGGYIWKFKYGSVGVFVQLTGLTDEDTFTVWATVLQLPVQDETRLMRKLLEMNWSDTFESCFGIFNNQVVALVTRAVADLSPGEISRSITIVATVADNNDDILQQEFHSS